MPKTEIAGKQILDQSIKLDAPNQDVVGVLPAGNGGTGNSTNPLNNVLLGNGTGALQTVAPGAAGGSLVSNGTTWVRSDEKLTKVGTSKLTVASTAPASPATGDLWVDTT